MFSEILIKTKNYVIDIFMEIADDKFMYHDLKHTLDVVEATGLIAEAEGLSKAEVHLLQIAAWFHDVGYLIDVKNHEETSVKLMREFFSSHNISSKDIDFVSRCIMATKYNTSPQDLYEQIIADADLHGLGVPDHFDRAEQFKKEVEALNGKYFDDLEWVNFEIEFLETHQYYTKSAQEMYGKLKQDHLNYRKNELKLLLNNS